MSRRSRPKITQRSEHWLRILVNSHPDVIRERLVEVFGLDPDTKFQWLSPIEADSYAEYRDGEFLDLLGLTDLRVPLSKFWPRQGPSWDGLAKTDAGQVFLFEAKAYAEECVDYKSRACAASLALIRESLKTSKEAFRAKPEACWECPLYQYANRLAHLYFLAGLNKKDAYLAFIYFADAPDVPVPCSVAEWKGAIRVVKKCLGLGQHPFRRRVADIIIDVREVLAG